MTEIEDLNEALAQVSEEIADNWRNMRECMKQNNCLMAEKNKLYGELERCIRGRRPWETTRPSNESTLVSFG